VTDPDIHAEVGALVDFGPPLKSAVTVFNQWRACWDNHEHVTEERKRIKREKEAEAAERIKKELRNSKEARKAR